MDLSHRSGGRGYSHSKLTSDCEMTEKGCLVCASPIVEIGTVDVRRFRFTPSLPELPKRAEIFACRVCGHIQKVHSRAEHALLGELYNHYNDGNFSPCVSQAVFTDGAVRTREELVLEKCSAELKSCRDLL